MAEPRLNDSRFSSAGKRDSKKSLLCCDPVSRNFSRVKRLLQILAIVLAFVWVPITSHCAWEDMPGLEFFKCADESTKSSQRACDESQQEDCADDACSTLESGSYKVGDTFTVVPALSSTVVFIQLALSEIIPCAQPSPVRASPSEIPVSWKFLSRTALPPRAPSLA